MLKKSSLENPVCQKLLVSQHHKELTVNQCVLKSPPQGLIILLFCKKLFIQLSSGAGLLNPIMANRSRNELVEGNNLQERPKESSPCLGQSISRTESHSPLKMMKFFVS